MSRRTDKKKLKRAVQAQAVQSSPVNPAAETSVPETSANGCCPFFIQYQNLECSAEDILAQIQKKCTEEGMDPADLRVYVKPEDRKAYFTCAGGNSFIDL